MMDLDNKYKSIIVQLKVSLELGGQWKNRGDRGWCKFVCVWERVELSMIKSEREAGNDAR